MKIAIESQNNNLALTALAKAVACNEIDAYNTSVSIILNTVYDKTIENVICDFMIDNNLPECFLSESISETDYYCYLDQLSFESLDLNSYYDICLEYAKYYHLAYMNKDVENYMKDWITKQKLNITIEEVRKIILDLAEKLVKDGYIKIQVYKNAIEYLHAHEIYCFIQEKESETINNSFKFRNDEGEWLVSAECYRAETSYDDDDDTYNNFDDEGPYQPKTIDYCIIV